LVIYITAQKEQLRRTRWPVISVDAKHRTWSSTLRTTAPPGLAGASPPTTPGHRRRRPGQMVGLRRPRPLTPATSRSSPTAVYQRGKARAWRQALRRQLYDRHRLTATVCHSPPGPSRSNAVEQRLFSEISQNWAGRPPYEDQVWGKSAEAQLTLGAQLTTMASARQRRTGTPASDMPSRGCSVPTQREAPRRAPSGVRARHTISSREQRCQQVLQRYHRRPGLTTRQLDRYHNTM
jgi:Rhodopirellula transposase DDE domain